MGVRTQDLNAQENVLDSLIPHDCVLAFDNGVTGALATCNTVSNIITFNLSKDYVKSVQSYTKIKKNITRIDCFKLTSLVKSAIQVSTNPVAIIERPMVNPRRFVASCSALRALEATLVVLENLSIPVVYCDSKEWQHKLFEKNPTGDTKEKSRETGLKLYPQFTDKINKQDADALLIMHWYMMKLKMI